MPEAIVRDGVRLRFDVFGSNGDPFVLLVSGAGAPAQFWPTDFCASLAAVGRHVVRYDHRDTGLSTHFDAEYPIDELLLDMLALVEHVGVPHAHIVGHSMGGYLTQIAMCQHPDKVVSATSISAGPPVSPKVAQALGLSSASAATWENLMRNHPQGEFEQDLPGWLTSWRFLNGSRTFDTTAATAYTRHLYEGDPRNAQMATHHIYAMTTMPPLERELARVRCPFLVLHGTNDPLVPLDNGEASARVVPMSRIHALVGAGHMFFNHESWQEIAVHLSLQTI